MAASIVVKVGGATMLLASVLLMSLLVAEIAHASSSSAEEDLESAKVILAKLNNKEKCELPSYEEIEFLRAKFFEITSMSGTPEWLDIKADYELALNSFLGQWGEFQQLLAMKTFTNAAMKRRFLNKIEQYQLKKHGFSICLEKQPAAEAQ